MRELLERLEALHSKQAHAQILQEIEQLEQERTNPVIVGIYARALNNLERYEEALAALESVHAQTQHDALWCYRAGYALLGLGRNKEAVAELAQAAVLDPGDEQITALLAKARGEQALSLDDPQYLLVRLQEALGNVQSEIREGALWIPGWRATVRAEMGKGSEQMAVLYFWITSPDWERTFFECSAALGQDQAQAIGMALGSFVYGLLGAVGKQAHGKPSERIECAFAGKTRRWKVYQSNLIGMGETPAEKDFYSFWKLLHKGITARLGNQQAVYVKVYAARNGDEVTGECRLNDEVSAELSALVADYARGWQTQQFGSQKQFFILRREEEGYAPYDETRITDAVRKAVALFSKCETNEQYGRYLDDLVAALGDRSLAEELDAFLPEFCAESAFRNILYPETIRLRWGERDETLYKSQLASYDLARRALYNELAEDYFDDELFGRFVSVSSIFSVIQNAKEQGADLEQEGGSISLCCSLSEQYQLR